MSAAGADNVSANSDNIIFTIKDTKLCSCCHFISKRQTKIYQNFLAKDLKRTFIGMKINENKSTANEYRYFLESNFAGVSRLSILVYSNQDGNAKRFNAWKFYLPEGIIDNYNVIINGKHFYDQPDDFVIKRYEEIRKLTTRQGKDYTTGWIWDYDYIKYHYRLIAIDLSRQKQSDADSYEIQQIEFVGQLKNIGANGTTTVADGTQNMFILKIIEKIKD